MSKRSAADMPCRSQGYDNMYFDILRTDTRWIANSRADPRLWGIDQAEVSLCIVPPMRIFDDENDEGGGPRDEDPILQGRTIPHVGTVNGLRAQRLATPILQFLL
ncbi:hypothetical protein BYT27DRAFT_7257364 [Phlegmacium glaucopus]|nr:hypothetical protein BYT27DRAFT_7257364 [Phlegmacium glaucopus]